MDLRKFYLSPKGRIGRADWWLKYVVVSLVIAVVAAILDSVFGLYYPEAGAGPISILVTVLMIYPAIIVTIKRFHDRNKSGWWMLIVLIPLVGGLWILIDCGFLRGTVGSNRFGPDPVQMPATV